MVLLKGGTAAARILAFQTPSILHAPRQTSLGVCRTAMHVGRDGPQVSLGARQISTSFAAAAAAATAWSASPGVAMAADSVQSALTQAPMQDAMMNLGVRAIARPRDP